MVVVAIALMCGAAAEAAPIAFTFQATVTRVNGDLGALNLPFTLTTGQQISGTYKFASESDLIDIILHPEYYWQHPELAKSGTLALNIGGTSLSGSVNTTGNMLFDPPISEPGPLSTLSLGYFGPTNHSHAGFIAGLSWDHQFTAVGPDGILADPTTDPTHFFDLAAWNQLTIRRGLLLAFGDFFQVVTVETTVGNFSAVTEPAAVGDFNSDGRIDASDYVVLRHNNGSAADYNSWRERFGQPLTASGASLESAPVPEASSLALLIFAAFTLLPPRRRKSVPHNRA